VVDISNNVVWSEVAANNNSTGTLPGYPENMAPSLYDDNNREFMAALKRFYDHINPTVTSGGSANAQTLTYTQGPVGYITGDVFFFIAGFTNSGDTTLNVSGLGGLHIKYNGANLVGGEIVAGQIIGVAFDGTNLQLISKSGGIINPGLTIGSVVIVGATGLTQDNANLFWDAGNHRLGIGTNAPAYPVQVGSTNYQQDAKICLVDGNGVNTRTWSIRTIYGASTTTDPNYGFAIRDENAGADRLFISFNSGNVGIGNTTPGYKLDVTGDINTSATLRLAGAQFAVVSGNYVEIFDKAGNGAIFLGNGSDPQNYYRQSTHTFQSIAGGATYATINATGISTPNSISASNTIDAGVDLHISSARGVSTQGGYMQWNRDGTGRTFLANQKGGGSGGLSIGEVTTGNAYTQTANIDPSGNLSLAGTISSLGSVIGLAFGGSGANSAAGAFSNIVVAASSLASTGYLKFQNGVYLQWGGFTTTATTASTVSFATPFPNGLWACIPTLGIAGGTSVSWGIGPQSLSQFQLVKSDTAVYGGFFVAIGF
jgi:hypothetical protein